MVPLSAVESVYVNVALVIVLLKVVQVDPSVERCTV